MSHKGSKGEVTVTSYHVGKRWRVPETAPLIRLRGRWLAQAGFRERQKVRVSVVEGRIVLERAPEETIEAAKRPPRRRRTPAQPATAWQTCDVVPHITDPANDKGAFAPAIEVQDSGPSPEGALSEGGAE